MIPRPETTRSTDLFRRVLAIAIALAPLYAFSREDDGDIGASRLIDAKSNHLAAADAEIDAAISGLRKPLAQSFGKPGAKVGRKPGAAVPLTPGKNSNARNGAKSVTLPRGKPVAPSASASAKGTSTSLPPTSLPLTSLFPTTKKPTGNVSVPDMRAPGMGDPTAIGNGPVIAAPAAVSDASGKEETVDFSEDVANSFNPYLFNREPLWSLLPLGTLLLLGLHLLPVPKRKRKRKIQTEDFLKELKGSTGAPIADGVGNTNASAIPAGAISSTTAGRKENTLSGSVELTRTATHGGFTRSTGFPSPTIAVADVRPKPPARKPTSSSEGNDG